MSVLYYPFLEAVTVVSGANTIIYHDGTADRTATITAGTYYLRGDGTASDLLKAIETALEGAPSSARTLWSTALQFDVDADNPAVIAQLGATGAFTLKVTGTFDLALLGFTAEQASSGASVISDSTATCAWLANEPPTFDDDTALAESAVHRSPAGNASHFDVGGPFDDVRIGFEMLDPNRVRARDNTADSAATFRAFWERIRTGTVIEVHRVAISSGSVLAALSSSTLLGDYKLAEESCAEFSPVRFSPGVALYSFDLRLLEVP